MCERFRVFFVCFVDQGYQVGWKTVLFARKSCIWVWNCSFGLFAYCSDNRQSDHLHEFLFMGGEKRLQDKKTEDCLNPPVNFMVGDQSLAKLAFLYSFLVIHCYHILFQ